MIVKVISYGLAAATGFILAYFIFSKTPQLLASSEIENRPPVETTPAPEQTQKALAQITVNTTDLDDEVKNLIIYKKALYNADNVTEGNLLNMLNPIINSKSVWKSHALYLAAEYFYFKNQKQKAKEFFDKIISLENSIPEIRIQAEKRLNRDLSE